MKQSRTLFSLAIMLLSVSVSGVVKSSAAKGRLDIDAMVKDMLAGLNSHTQVVAMTATYGTFPMERAYRIQTRLAGQCAVTMGPVCGYKVAYASKAAQKQFGMGEPARGPLYLSQRVPSGSTLPADVWNEIMLETEIAFTIGKRIDKPIASVAEIKPYVKSLHPAFDAGNFPYTVDKAKPGPVDMVAIGTGAHIFILGPAVCPQEVGIDNIDLSLVRNGETIRESPSRDIMGSPWNSLLWCANNLNKFGQTLEPGMVVLCGTAAPAYRVKGDDIKGKYVGDCGPLGKVTLTIK